MEKRPLSGPLKPSLTKPSMTNKPTQQNSLDKPSMTIVNPSTGVKPKQ
ncbi:MAG TPA: hypothetical protein VEY70_16040 [Metabacillus sp.]|nr:hypothetical protein [Metabacillus sp.]